MPWTDEWEYNGGEGSLGHNQPPSQIEFTKDISKEISQFLLDNPSFVANEELARAAKLWLDRATLCRADLETERKGKTEPLRGQVEDINARYRPVRETLEVNIEAIKRRLTDSLRAAEQERQRRVEEARKAVEEAERRARSAEAAEKAAHEEARLGAVVDTIDATVTADRAFEEFQKASRFQARVEAEKVKVAGGLRRATSLREKETLTVTNPVQVIQMLWELVGLSEGLLDVIKTEARAFRKIHGHLPDGVEATIERDV